MHSIYLVFLMGLICYGADKPNVIYILADDLGYGELGCYGQEKIKTPNIDALAKTGKRFTRHYCGAPVCAPSCAKHPLINFRRIST